MSDECPRCHLHFSGTTAFDRHQTTAYGTPRPVTCHDPAARGLVLTDRGVWGFPATDASRARFASLAAERDRVKGNG